MASSLFASLNQDEISTLLSEKKQEHKTGKTV